MRIKNKTSWMTKDLAQMVKEVSRQTGLTLPIVAEFEYGRLDRIHGLGSICSRWIKIFLPRNLERLDGEMLKDIAEITAHEMRHNNGERDGDLDINAENVDVNMITVRKRPAKPKPTIGERKQERYNKVIERITYNEKLVKRAQTRLRKLYAKRKYYEKNKN